MISRSLASKERREQGRSLKRNQGVKVCFVFAVECDS